MVTLVSTYAKLNIQIASTIKALLNPMYGNVINISRSLNKPFRNVATIQLHGVNNNSSKTKSMEISPWWVWPLLEVYMWCLWFMQLVASMVSMWILLPILCLYHKAFYHLRWYVLHILLVLNIISPSFIWLDSFHLQQQNHKLDVVHKS